jgi:hypothetical protein
VLKVPALVCDNCGDTSFSQAIAERLGRLSDESILQVPTGFYTALEFDLETMDKATAEGRRPVVTSTDLVPPGYAPLNGTGVTVRINAGRGTEIRPRVTP